MKTYLEVNNLPQSCKLLLAGDCADGLHYLSQRGFIHRDVAARNMLISSTRRAKIADVSVVG